MLYQEAFFRRKKRDIIAWSPRSRRESGQILWKWQRWRRTTSTILQKEFQSSKIWQEIHEFDCNGANDAMARIIKITWTWLKRCCCSLDLYELVNGNCICLLYTSSANICSLMINWCMHEWYRSIWQTWTNCVKGTMTYTQNFCLEIGLSTRIRQCHSVPLNLIMLLNT